MKSLLDNDVTDMYSTLKIEVTADKEMYSKYGEAAKQSSDCTETSLFRCELIEVVLNIEVPSTGFSLQEVNSMTKLVIDGTGCPRFRDKQQFRGFTNKYKCKFGGSVFEVGNYFVYFSVLLSRARHVFEM